MLTITTQDKTTAVAGFAKNQNQVLEEEASPRGGMIPLEAWGTPAFTDQNGYDWSQASIFYLQHQLFWESMEEMENKNNTAEIFSIVAWVFAPAIRKDYYFDQAAGYSRVLKSHEYDEPFSFVNCCKVVGMDPDEIRAGFRRNLPSSLIEKAIRTRA